MRLSGEAHAAWLWLIPCHPLSLSKVPAYWLFHSNGGQCACILHLVCADVAVAGVVVARALQVDRQRTPWLVVGLHRQMVGPTNDPVNVKTLSRLQGDLEDVFLKHKVDLVLQGGLPVWVVG